MRHMELTISNNKIIYNINNLLENKITYKGNDLIKKLTLLIIDNPNILNFMANYYLYLDDEKIKENIDAKKNVLTILISRNIATGKICDKNFDFEKFRDIFLKVNNEDLGKVLENIIVYIGPYKKEKFNQINISRDTKIFETEMDNDFDVVFFDKFSEDISINSVQIYGYNEFFECKKNVCTFIPYDSDKQLKQHIENKLKFIKKVYDIKNNNGNFYIATFFPKVTAQQDFLKHYNNGEYSFLKILDIFKIYELFTQ